MVASRHCARHWLPEQAPRNQRVIVVPTHLEQLVGAGFRISPTLLREALAAVGELTDFSA
jgi:hypothetical protein